jgi:glycosyltransferase involved in cell wall biosynthesis
MALHRVALVASSYHPYVGGVEEHVRSVARELRRRGHEVVVWTVDRGEHLGIQRVDGIEVRHLPTPLPARSPSAVLRFLAAFPGACTAWLRAWIAFRPDVLHIQCFGPNGLYAVALASVVRSPLVLSSHGETFMDDHEVFERSALLRAGLVRGLQVARAVTGCSRVALEDLVRRFGGRPGVVVPNGVDLDVPSPEARVASAGQRQRASPPVVFAVGRVVHRKGFDLLVRAFAVADLPDGTRLAIGGDGPELAALGRLAAELGVDDAVRLVGRLSPGEVARYMEQSSVVVVPSRREAFGIVVLEAWRAGTPVVATSRGGPGEFVTDGVDGFLVDPEDVGALGAKLEQVVSDGALASRVGAAGLERVREFTWERTALAYEELYDRVAAGATPGLDGHRRGVPAR